VFCGEKGIAAGKVLLVLVAMCLAAMAGARLLNALANFSAYLAEPGRLWQAGAEGFSLYGGIWLHWPPVILRHAGRN